MGAFLAYFDLLGYKNFIEGNSNDLDKLHRRVGDFARDVESALSLDHPKLQSPHHVGDLISDISHSTLDCIIFSDTVVFVTTGSTLQDFEELVKVSYKYNTSNVINFFPSRGCVVYGDVWVRPFEQKNQRGGTYMANMIYGNALVDAHLKAEAMSWAGCVLDKSAIDFAQSLGNIEALLQDYTMEYEVPYKRKDKDFEEEIRISERAFIFKNKIVISKYYEDSIRRAFTQDNKGEIVGRVEVIFNNTIEFLRAHSKFPFYYKADKSAGEISVHVYGRLDADYTHTTVTRQQQGEQDATYRVDTVKMVLGMGTNIDFVLEPEINSEEFNQQLANAKQ